MKPSFANTERMNQNGYLKNNVKKIGRTERRFKMKMPKNEKELDNILMTLGRIPEQIEATKDFSKLLKAFGKPDKEFYEIVKNLKDKYKIDA